jgi:hypothetical protein
MLVVAIAAGGNAILMRGLKIERDKQEALESTVSTLDLSDHRETAILVYPAPEGTRLVGEWGQIGGPDVPAGFSSLLNEQIPESRDTSVLLMTGLWAPAPPIPPKDSGDLASIGDRVMPSPGDTIYFPRFAVYSTGGADVDK